MTKRIKVANVTEESRWGGPQTRIINIAAGIQKDNIDTTVLYSTIDAQKLEESIDRKGVSSIGLKIRRPTAQMPGCLLYIIFFLIDVVKISYVLSSGRFDLVHCNSSRQIKGVLSAYIVGIPVVWHINDTRSPRVVKWGFNIVKSLVDGLIFSSKRSRKYYMSEYGTDVPCEIIQAPVNTDVYNPGNIESVGRSDKSLTVVAVANANPAKGILDFIRMVEVVDNAVDEKIKYRLAGSIAGSKNYRLRVRNRLGQCGVENLRAAGHVDDVRQLLSYADVYVCSSKHEASPIAVWEAMAMAVPVVSTDVGDVSYFLEGGGCRAGTVVQVGDVQGLACGVIELLKDSQKRLKFGIHARKIAVQYLDKRVCVKKHKKIYNKVLK